MNKVLIILFLSICCSNCSIDDDANPSFSFELIPVLDAELPEELKKDSIYDFKVRYLRPTTCHGFRGYDYNHNGNERIVAIVNIVSSEALCTKLEQDTVQTDLSVRITQDDFYLFKFWQGKDAEGKNKFLTKRIPVISPQ